MLFAEARRAARRTPEGDFVPLEQQDTSRWSRPMLDEADRLLHQAFARHRPGPWQLEAAIQSVHVVGGLTGRRDLRALVDLYDGLVHFAPSLGALVGRAAALLEAAGPEAALQALDALEERSTDDYQPYWVVRAQALDRAGRSAEARAARERAIGLTEDAAVRRHLLREGAKAARP
jgi:RNA polymerase sigma-70 factor (ECF subfamily)